MSKSQRTWLRNLCLLCTAGMLMLTGCDPVTNNNAVEEPTKEEKAEQILAKDGQPIAGQYIVVLKKSETDEVDRAKAAQSAELQINTVVNEVAIPEENIRNRYTNSITGFAAQLNDAELEALRKNERVEFIEQDKIIMLSPPKASQSFWCIYFGIGCDYGGGDPQETPYGINRVGGAVDGSGLRAWVIDTGVDLDHADLNVNTQLSTSFVSGESSADDGNGHGTHVAGTIAAVDNSIDVVGVAAGAEIVAVKVLDSSGSGTISSVVGGIDYVAANASPGDVANMSLGGGASTSLDNAVLNAANQGIMFAIAAGNDGANANNYSPARVNHSNVWTVSAIDSNDQFASFSNYANPPVDYAAPGVNVKSLWRNGGVNTISGTSMASPHMAGVLLVTGGNPSVNGFAVGDPDGNADPIAVH